MPAIYLDHAATTPLLPAAHEAMLEGFAHWANPSSPHKAGRAARAALEEARARVKAALGWTGEVIFTSGASEALGIALGRAQADRQIVSAVEHDAVFRAAPGADVLPIRDGAPDGEALAALLAAPGRAVVAVQSINSETGTVLMPSVQNVLAEQVRAAGGLLLADCSQSAGKGALPDADMLVVSAHKLGGPIGVGALLVRDWAMLQPSGGQERGYRHGTENLPGALGLAAALEAGGLESWQTTAKQRLDFRNALFRHGEVLTPGFQCRHIFAVAAPRMAANAMLIRMDSLGFAISAGSACSSGTLKPSHVLQGFGIDPEVARRTVRVSIGWNTTLADLDAFAAAWAEVNA
ncbi:cysteine desulfurase family protein [Novosphingobium sp. AAP93]|uniref:cysteine desulfurase family protein n=1 Tax=Novosphingobium sp. AAP93 TaxID=1523427 RepID=UPI0006B96C97|nr:aminotransferase class V-fold PLP-dependent enzyme [Novosphingobium sp. AAP93]KPF89905.1 aminotransferase [Novosphingobium sp. AAP93]